MMLWHKILIICLGLYVFTFSLSAVVFMTQSHWANLEQETHRALSDQALINERMAAGLETLGPGAILEPDPLIRRYSDFYALREIELSIYNVETKRLVGPLDLAQIDSRLLQVGSDEQIAYVSSVFGPEDEKRRLIFVSSPLLEHPDHLLLYARDVSSLYQQRDQMIRTVAGLALLMVVVLGIATFFLARRLTRPLYRLGQAADEVASGHYQALVPQNKDETARLVEAFNKMSEAVRQREQRLAEEAESRQLFIDNLTHEMNTPLTAIQGYAELLQQAKINAAQQDKAAATIRTEAHRLRELQDKLTSLILLRQGDIEWQKIPLPPFLEHLSRVMTMQLREKELRLELQCELDFLHADADLLEILLSNLIRNSIKASRTGQTITVRAWRRPEGNAQLTVSDAGRGIPEHLIEKVFEPFFRVDTSRSRQTGGTGLGLALCLEIAKRHGAKLKLESKLHQGTWVHLIFPIEKT